ncbi:hypothetical protein K5F27_17055 [Acinetobacter baumannii]|uniref:hypothetical protein n=1 Tax=Acinetobacter baumannii TaxID=470 RepID=UPI001FF56675|nr:hypothetical protein [Acinetobacter baumannii]MCJ9119021.1 hypothetical protein [Acinetobacter baumannii]MCJ9181382.1 hypothetical protein [Acinetobacter baumannii]MCJ9185053.1 hypothetical protein [Acinetobacter baumannii]MCJ9192366.1 hypothetical protein [Acinetobacter baumannii]MCJ9199695.1 hypothetical protein [Acinetobacter baumannii]
MAKYDSTVQINSNNPTSGNSRERAKAWINVTLRLKDGATSNIGIPLMESDYVQRSVMHVLNSPDLTESERNEIVGKMFAKAITNGDITYRIVAERDENAVGELDL